MLPGSYVLTLSDRYSINISKQHKKTGTTCVSDTSF